MEEIKSTWSEALSILKKGNINEISYNTWFMPLSPCGNEDGFILLKAPNELIKNTVEARYIDQLKSAVKIASSSKYDVKVVCDTRKVMKEAKIAKNDDLSEQSNLNPKYVFDTFVIGNGNRLAHAASMAVAEAPAKIYNPLFLYGGVGLGKTHLMHSIAHYILEHNPESRVLYVSSETFTNELINSIKNNTNEDFRNKYRNIDVLLIDDIQFIAQKESTQEEFFHTFNTLHLSNKQIIISSDRPPKEIKTLEDRLRSRFEWGLIADIQPPDFETRIAILRKKADSENVSIPDDIMEFIAKSIVSNIRELEGALIKVASYAKLVPNQTITMDFAQDALKDIIGEKTAVTVTIQLIQERVSDYYGITVDDILSNKRPNSIAFPRQVAMYLSRKLLDISLPKIGEQFGGRDHSTVINSLKKVDAKLEKDPEFQETLLDLEKRIKY